MKNEIDLGSGDNGSLKNYRVYPTSLEERLLKALKSFAMPAEGVTPNNLVTQQPNNPSPEVNNG